MLPNVLMWPLLSALQGWGTGNIGLPMTPWLGDLPLHAHTQTLVSSQGRMANWIWTDDNNL